jgi:hypothetical protein
MKNGGRVGSSAGLRRTAGFAALILTVSVLLGVAASAAQGGARSATACPVTGQCGVDPKTHCPTGGPSSGAHPASVAPIKVSPPAKCVSVPTTLFYVHASNALSCNEVLFVQVKLQPGIKRYESVVYSEIGLGTRWWADPSTPLDQTGPATHAGQTFKYGLVAYTVPKGYLAWDVGGGTGGPTSCTDTAPPSGVYGQAGWGVKTATKKTGSSHGSSKMSIHGPTHNLYHVSFNQVITGTASAKANYVQSGEQLGWTPRCASTLTAEEQRSGWTPWPTGTGPVHGHFRLVAAFYSHNHLKHGICAYLINSSTKHTYAHAARYWSNS